MAPQVNVLLSTYNGSLYLSQQLDSILQQSWPRLIITVRDDGSTDCTGEILRSYAARYPNVRVLTDSGSHLGTVNSFFALLNVVDESSEYFAFADQDDLWMPAKLEEAITELSATNMRAPVVYCSRLEYVDSNLRHLGYSRTPKRVGFGNALVENVVAGPTAVFNSAARWLMCQAAPSPNIVMHDWWLYLVVSAFGHVVFDPMVTVRYRQHSANQMGSAHAFLSRGIRRLLRFATRGRAVFNASTQASDFLRTYARQLSVRERAVAEAFVASKASLRARVLYACRPQVWRQTTVDTLLLRLLILLDMY